MRNQSGSSSDRGANVTIEGITVTNDVAYGDVGALLRGSFYRCNVTGFELHGNSKAIYHGPSFYVETHTAGTYETANNSFDMTQYGTTESIVSWDASESLSVNFHDNQLKVKTQRYNELVDAPFIPEGSNKDVSDQIDIGA